VPVLRAHRRDCLVAALLAPAPYRKDLLALISLDYEWARTRSLVSDPTLGAIRLAWWREALSQTASGFKPPHPMLAAMATRLRTEPHLQPLLDDVIAGYEADLSPEPATNMSDWLTQAGRTATPFCRLWVAFCGGDQAMLADDLIGRIGVFRGASLMLAYLPHAFSEQICPLPRNVLADYQTHSARLLDFPNDPALGHIIKACWQVIETQRRPLFQDLRHAPLCVRLSGLLAHAVTGRLNAIKAADFHPFQASDIWHRPDGNLGLRLIRARYWG